jgi:hypothetical protein
MAIVQYPTTFFDGTTNPWDGYTAEASSTFQNNVNVKGFAFNNNFSDGIGGYHSQQLRYEETTGAYTGSNSLGGIFGEWFYLDSPTVYMLQHYVMWARPNFPERLPYTWAILGSNDLLSWTVVDDRLGPTTTGVPFADYFPGGTPAGIQYTVNGGEENTPFTTYAMVVTNVGDGETTNRISVQVMELQLFGIDGTCFHPDCALRLSDGSDVPARDVRVGDMLQMAYVADGVHDFDNPWAVRVAEVVERPRASPTMPWVEFAPHALGRGRPCRRTRVTREHPIVVVVDGFVKADPAEEDRTCHVMARSLVNGHSIREITGAEADDGSTHVFDFVPSPTHLAARTGEMRVPAVAGGAGANVLCDGMKVGLHCGAQRTETARARQWSIAQKAKADGVEGAPRRIRPLTTQIRTRCWAR